MFFVCVRNPFTIQRFSGKTCTQTYKSPERFTEMLHFLLCLGEKCQNPSPATYVWTSIERKFAESMDLADEGCVYAKLPKGFSIPTPVGNYSPDWAIAFNEGVVKHIFFIAETKGTMETLNLKPIEQAKIACAKKLFSNLLPLMSFSFTNFV